MPEYLEAFYQFIYVLPLQCKKYFLCKICNSPLTSWEGLLPWRLVTTMPEQAYSPVPYIERRRDRYMVIFIWKVAMRFIDGYDMKFSGENSRRGRECTVANIVRSSPISVRKAREGSLSVKGARMFNLLPIELRNLDSDKVYHFKKELDKFLDKIPDQPTIAEEGRAAETNCLLHQIPMATTTNIMN